MHNIQIAYAKVMRAYKFFVLGEVLLFVRGALGEE